MQSQFHAYPYDLEDRREAVEGPSSHITRGES